MANKSTKRKHDWIHYLDASGRCADCGLTYKVKPRVPTLYKWPGDGVEFQSKKVPECPGEKVSP